MRQNLSNKFISELKKNARRARTGRGIPLGKALDEQAAAAGYASWRELMAAHEGAKTAKAATPGASPFHAPAGFAAHGANDGILPGDDPRRARYEELLAKMGGAVEGGEGALSQTEKEEFARIADVLWKLDPLVGTPGGRGIYRTIGVVGGRFMLGHALYDPTQAEGRVFRVGAPSKVSMKYEGGPFQWTHQSVLVMAPAATRARHDELLAKIGGKDPITAAEKKDEIWRQAPKVGGKNAPAAPKTYDMGSVRAAAARTRTQLGLPDCDMEFCCLSCGSFFDDAPECRWCDAGPAWVVDAAVGALVGRCLCHEVYEDKCPFHGVPREERRLRHDALFTTRGLTVPPPLVSASGKAAWDEYDRVAGRLAEGGTRWKDGDPIPEGIGAECRALIEEDPEAFEERVRATAYAKSMEGVREEDGE